MPSSRSFATNMSANACKQDYSDIYADNPTIMGVALGFVIVGLTIATEVAVHSWHDPNPKTKKPQSARDEVSEPGPRASHVPPPSEASNTATGTANSTDVKWNRNPSPAVRANRLALATLFIIPLCIAFGLRIAGLAPPDVRYECREVLRSSMEPWWWLIIPFNIIPFVVASVAWIRAFVDCLLVRWSKAVPYPGENEGSGVTIGWPPVAPLYWAYMLILLPIGIISQFVKKGAIWMMGSPDLAGDTPEDIELGGEERARLVDDVDDAVVDEREEPPAYHTHWRENETENKI